MLFEGAAGSTAIEAAAGVGTPASASAKDSSMPGPSLAFLTVLRVSTAWIGSSDRGERCSRACAAGVEDDPDIPPWITISTVMGVHGKAFSCRSMSGTAACTDIPSN